jgi:hypothetical protein
VIVAAANTDSDFELESKYRIERDSQAPQYRLFVRGFETPIANNFNVPTVCDYGVF